MSLAERSRAPIPLKRKLRVYVSGKMRGVEGLNFDAFDAATERLRSLGHEVFNPAEADREAAESFNLRRAFADDMWWIALHADAIAVLPDWEDSLGAKAEVALARAIEIPVAPVEAFWPSGPDPRALL